MDLVLLDNIPFDNIEDAIEILEKRKTKNEKRKTNDILKINKVQLSANLKILK